MRNTEETPASEVEVPQQPEERTIQERLDTLAGTATQEESTLEQVSS